MHDEASTVETPSSEPSQPEEKRAPGRPAKNEDRVRALETDMAETKQTLGDISTQLGAIATLLTQQPPPSPPAYPTDNDPEDAAPPVVEVVPWGEDGRYTYSCESKECTIRMIPDLKMVVDGQVVYQPAKWIEFQEGFLVTDDPKVRDFIESLPEFKVGKPYRIARGAELRPRAVSVHDGPRTMTQTPIPVKVTPRPMGALSAPLN